MPNYRVEVHEVHIFRNVEAETDEQAREIASEDYIWDGSDGKYFVYMNVDLEEFY